VIDNVVWTDSWLSIAGAGCGLTDVERERSSPVRPPGVEDHVWFEDRWMVASLCDE
jgi:hypothetical protein